VLRSGQHLAVCHVALHWRASGTQVSTMTQQPESPILTSGLRVVALRSVIERDKDETAQDD
jgi:hypothetical protein